MKPDKIKEAVFSDSHSRLGLRKKIVGASKGPPLAQEPTYKQPIKSLSPSKSERQPLSGWRPPSLFGSIQTAACYQPP